MDVGLLVIRLAIGLFLAAHGAQKLFGSFGGHGLAGTGGFLESLGYRPGRANAALAGLAELGGGLLLALGLLTPLGAAAAIGVMVNAMGSVHWRNGIWSAEGGVEYPLVLAAVAAGLACTGAGEVSIDHALGLDLAGSDWGILAILIGVGTGVVLLASRRPAQMVDDAEVRGAAQTAVESRR
jgi:putative oxidoreductase